MIWIPEKEKCSVWNDLGDTIHIEYVFNENIRVRIEWNTINGKFEPYSLIIKKLEILNKDNGWTYWVSIPVLCCSEAACQCPPELRYNNILKKWFCFCASSMICTHNTDESELEHPSIADAVQANTIDAEHGFFDNPIDALLNWNKQLAQEIIAFCEKNMTK